MVERRRTVPRRVSMTIEELLVRALEQGRAERLARRRLLREAERARARELGRGSPVLIRPRRGRERAVRPRRAA